MKQLFYLQLRFKYAHSYAAALFDDFLQGIAGVDVCLVLVIIFMVTAPLLSTPAFKVELPKARTQEGEEKDKTILSLSADGSPSFGLRDENEKLLMSLTTASGIKLFSEDGKVVWKAP